jgi:hypothetical protein
MTNEQLLALRRKLEQAHRTNNHAMVSQLLSMYPMLQVNVSDTLKLTTGDIMKIKFLNGTEKEFENLCRANLRDADLSAENLSGEDLSGADLTYADLSYVNLRDANLRDANLSGANLRGANLCRANLRGANLRGANLRDANLRGADLPWGYKIARLDFGGWSVTITPETTTIGCQSHANNLWLKAKPAWIRAMHQEASAWWKQHGAVVKALIRDVQS